MSTLRDVFVAAREEALSLAERGVEIEPEEIRQLDHRARIVLTLFNHSDQVTTQQVAQVLGLSPRMARVLLHDWVGAGWLEIVDPSNRKRAYGLSAIYRQFTGKGHSALTLSLEPIPQITHTTHLRNRSQRRQIERVHTRCSSFIGSQFAYVEQRGARGRVAEILRDRRKNGHGLAYIRHDWPQIILRILPIVRNIIEANLGWQPAEYRRLCRISTIRFIRTFDAPESCWQTTDLRQPRGGIITGCA